MMRGVRVLSAGLFAAGCLMVLVVSSAVTQAQAGKAKVDAAELYKTKCQVCHAADGNSPMPNMSFADGVWVHGSTLAAVQNTITNGAKSPSGTPTAMMPFKDQLSKEEIAALARYVRQFDKKLKK